MTSRAASFLRTTAPAVAVLAALGLSGCGATSPTQTEKDYAPADGVSLDLGGLKMRNLLLIANQSGGPATLTGAVENTGDASSTVTVAAGQSSTRLEVPARTLVTLSEREQSVLSSIQGTPGGMAQLAVVSTTDGQSSVSVPVQLAEGYYRTLAPTATPSTGTSATMSPAG